MENSQRSPMTNHPENWHALLQKIEVLDDFLDHANMPLHCIDAKGIIGWANQAELNLMGYTRDEYLGTPIVQHHAHAATLTQMMERLEREATLTDFPAVLKKADGTLVQVLINSSVYRKDGEFIHTRCLTRDVTNSSLANQQTTQLLHESERNQQMLNMALDAAAMGTWDYDLQTHQLTCSTHCRAIFGLGDEVQLSPRVLKELVVDEDLITLRADIQRGLSSGERITADFCIHKASNGELRHLQAQGKVYLGPDGSAKHFFGTVIDTTEATEAAERSAKLAAIIESSDDAIVSKSLQSIVTSWNHSAERMFGYTAAEMIGQSITKIIPADRLDEEPQIIAKLKNGERVDHFETVRQTKDGQFIHISLTISPIKNNQGEIVGVSKIARDISQQKKEQARKNDFVSMVSHELKTPLTSMLGYLQLLKRATKALPNDFSQNVLVKTELQVKKMTNMVHDFLNVARLEGGRIQLHKTEFELLPLANEVSSNLQLFNPGHSILVNVPSDIYCYGDREKIGQVLTNLLGNAVKYAPTNSHIWLNCTLHGKMARMAVKDEGMGISKADQLHLFERFYRVEQTGPGQPAGFGIGLYLSAELMRMHHSEIKVESELGKGATFYFDLPKRERAETPANPN